jgi:GntR family transcriptional regulator, vanillate catabolism transcriptional regulator
MGKLQSPAPHERSGRRAGVDSQIGRAFIGLREMLLHGELAPGERISELPLVARLGTSRTPIRLALERLEHIGLLDRLATAGFVVRGFTLTEVQDAIELRGVLEGTAARFAAERLRDDAELKSVRRCCDQMERLDGLTIDTFAVYMDLNEMFHAGLVQLAKSAMLERSVAQVSSLPFASASAMVSPTSILPDADANLVIANDHHRSIVDAIAQRQGSRAESIAREHSYVARRVLSIAMSDTNALRRIPGGRLIHVSTP